MTRSVITTLMFDGDAEAALELYARTFPALETGDVEYYDTDMEGPKGRIKHAAFTVHGQRFTCFDTPVRHAFDFTPSMSLFIECETEEELDEIVERLGDSGELLMPPDNYGFSRKFAWLNDRFGVSWQLNLQ